MLVDNCFRSKESIQFINIVNTKFIVGIKSNKTIESSSKYIEEDKFQEKHYHINIGDGESKQVCLKHVSFTYGNNKFN